MIQFFKKRCGALMRIMLADNNHNKNTAINAARCFIIEILAFGDYLMAIATQKHELKFLQELLIPLMDWLKSGYFIPVSHRTKELAAALNAWMQAHPKPYALAGLIDVSSDILQVRSPFPDGGKSVSEILLASRTAYHNYEPECRKIETKHRVKNLPAILAL